MIVGVFLTFIVALITIWGFMAWVKKMSYTPFVVYRVILGGILIFNAYIYIF
jgi:undecaprenyl-diphosphatase